MESNPNPLLGGALLGVAVIVAAVLPIIPVEEAAVIPNPFYRMTFVSIARLLDPTLMGVDYRFVPTTWGVLLGLAIGAWLAVRHSFFRKP